MSTGQKQPKQRRPRRKAEVEEGPIEKIEIDLLVVADWAQTINGKLYIQGGGWDRKLLPPREQPIDFFIAAGILVPWHMTNLEHQIRLSLETGDGDPVGSVITGGFTMGRPINSLAGQRFRTPFAGRINAKVPGLGAYQVTLAVNNDVTKRVVFYVVDQL